MMPKHRKFAHHRLQLMYDLYREWHPTPESQAGRGAAGNAYQLGYKNPIKPDNRFDRGSITYAAWAAGVDNAADAARRTNAVLKKLIE